MPAFPTAEGFGANSIGGRGGTVIQVTNLSDDGNPGSLRYALTQTFPRTVVFRVGGRIALTSTLNITSPYVTIAGQTAPGGGILLTGRTIQIKTHNVIGRFLRWRCGLANVNLSTGTDTNWVIYGDVAGTGDLIRHDIIFDHCEFSGATDQHMDAYGNVTDITYQNCLVYDGLVCGHTGTPSASHAFGSIMASQPWFGNVIRISNHRCVWSGFVDRAPLINTYLNPSAGILTQQHELKNCLIYNWQGDGGITGFHAAFHNKNEWTSYMSQIGWTPGTGTSGTVPIQCTAIGNHWIEGPNGNPNSGVGWISHGARLHIADSIYWPTGFSNIATDGFAIKVNRSDPPLEDTELRRWRFIRRAILCQISELQHRRVYASVTVAVCDHQSRHADGRLRCAGLSLSQCRLSLCRAQRRHDGHS